MKKVLSGKINNHEFLTESEDEVIISTDELDGRDISKKAFKRAIGKHYKDRVIDKAGLGFKIINN